MFLFGPEEASKKYGEIKVGTWLEESRWCSFLQIPKEYGSGWINSYGGTPVTKIYCNKDFQPYLLKALQNVKDRNLLQDLKTFDGCFGIRNVRGGSRLSAHSYGLAIDINAFENPLGSPGKMTDEFGKCFTDSGLTWGANFIRVDKMHFSLGW